MTTTTTFPTTVSEPTMRRSPGVWRSGLTATAAAAVANVLVAAGGRELDIPMAIQGEQIPVDGFAIMTALWAVVGIVMAKAMARWARSPRQLFVRATVALTLLSFVPSITADTDTATSVVLVLTHIVAACIVIPAVAARLDVATN